MSDMSALQCQNDQSLDRGVRTDGHTLTTSLAPGRSAELGVKSAEVTALAIANPIPTPTPSATCPSTAAYASSHSLIDAIARRYLWTRCCWSKSAHLLFTSAGAPHSCTSRRGTARRRDSRGFGRIAAEIRMSDLTRSHKVKGIEGDPHHRSCVGGPE